MHPESVLLGSFGEIGASMFALPSVLEKQFREERIDDHVHYGNDRHTVLVKSTVRKHLNKTQH
jgi:hypothetical protein